MAPTNRILALNRAYREETSFSAISFSTWCARSISEPPPVDVPGYTVVRARVASGQQPFPDGIAWLQTKGYRTVLHLRAPGEDGTAARRQFSDDWCPAPR